MKNSLTELEKRQKLENAIADLEKRFPPKVVDFQKKLDREFDLKEDQASDELYNAKKTLNEIESKINALEKYGPFLKKRRAFFHALYEGKSVGFAEVRQDAASEVCLTAVDKTKIPFEEFYTKTKKYAAYYENEIQPSYGTALFIIENGFASIINTNFDSSD